jgi:hypothetical protein
MTRRSRTLFTGALVLGLAAPAIIAAQGTPNFAGTWKLIEPGANRGKPVGGAGGPLASGGQDGFHPTLVIKQTAAEISLEGQTYHQDPEIHVYKLNGSDTTYDSPSGRVTAKAGWEGGKLVLNARRTFSSPIGDITVETKETYSLVNGVLQVEQDEKTMAGTSRKLATYGKATS